MSSPAAFGGWGLALASNERRLALRQQLLASLLAPLSVGAPLPEALLEASREHPSRLIRSALASLSRDLAQGRPLSEALADLQPLSDDMLIAAARAGERSGRLAEAFEACDQAIDLRLNVARGVADQILQPALSVACAIAFIVILLLAGTIPLMLEVSGPGGAIKRIVGSIGAHPGWSIGVLLAVVAVTLILLRLVPATAWGMRVIDALPLIGRLRIESRLGLLCRHVAIGCDAGVPLDEALLTSAELLPAQSSERAALIEMVRLVRAGEPPEVAAGQATGVPALLVAILSAPGPDRVSLRVARLSRWHESEASRLGEDLRALAGPLAVVAAGITCGTVVILAWAGYFGALSTMVE